MSQGRFLIGLVSVLSACAGLRIGMSPERGSLVYGGECDHEGMTLELTRTRAVLITFVILAIEPFAYAATRSWFWQHKYLMAPVATAAYLLVLAGLVLGRYRWAWLLLAVLYGSAMVTWGLDPHRFAPWYVLSLALNVAVFALLLSSPMRARLRRPVRVRARSVRVLEA